MSNVRIDWNFSFLAGYHADAQNQYCCNEYNVNLNMITVSTNGWDHDTAFERIKYFSTYVLSSCVFVDEKQTKAIEKYTLVYNTDDILKVVNGSVATIFNFQSIINVCEDIEVSDGEVWVRNAGV